jgi:hypothetical protein
MSLFFFSGDTHVINVEPSFEKKNDTVRCFLDLVATATGCCCWDGEIDAPCCGGVYFFSSSPPTACV